MFKRMIIKEWKEKSGLFVFALAGLVLFSLAASGYSKDKETLDILASTILLIFLPVFSLLLGASGFAAELQDGAWAYLFSRPVKKWRIWLAKYLSLLTVLAVVILLLALLTRVHPALKSTSATFSFPLVGDMSYGILAYVLPLMLFTTAFSFSILSEKTHVVAFMAALVWIVIQTAVTRAGFLLYGWGMESVFFLISIFSILVPLSLALASLLTLCRADFSQPTRRAWIFIKSAALFILAAIVLTSLFALGTGGLRSEHFFYGPEVRNNAFYFATGRGLYKFDPESPGTQRIARHTMMWGLMSLGGDKVAFVTFQLGRRRHGFADLRIVNSDGTEERSLVGTSDEASPFYGASIYPLRVSPQGDRVAFMARFGAKAITQDLWVINSDGTGLRGYDLDVPDAEYYLSIGFENTGQALYLFCTTKLKPGSQDQRVGAMLLRVNLQSGQVETIADQIRKPYMTSMAPEAMTSETGSIAFIQHDDATSREILIVLNPETLERRQVYAEDSVTAFRWNKAGNKLAFLTGKSVLGVYSAAEDKIIRNKELSGYDLRWPSQALEWALDGRLLLRRMEKWEVSSICLLDANLTEQKAIQLPFATSFAARIWSAGKYAIVENSENHQLWGVDLTTEKWVRIY